MASRHFPVTFQRAAVSPAYRWGNVPDMWAPRTLLITDSNLGLAAHSRLTPICADLTWLCWDIDGPEGAHEALARIAGERWGLTISFYSDLILPPEALATMDLPINIHPAGPCVRGVGHDVVPIVERHEFVGPTMHRIEPPIDTGEILDVLEVPFPPGHTYASLRTLNQSLTLQMLDRLIAAMMVSSGVAELEATLSQKAATLSCQWGAYYSRKTVAALRAAHAEELGIDMGPQAA
jgi:methionyl-tRNA formyltransferase